MKTSFRFIVPTFLALAVAQVAAGQGVTEQRTTLGKAAPSAARFLEVAGGRAGALADSVVLGDIEGPIQLRDAGVELFIATANVGDEKLVVALNAEGREIDLEAVKALDRALGVAKRGKMSQRLEDELRTRPVDQRQLVVAWLKAPMHDDLRNQHADEIDALEQAGMLPLEAAEQHQRELSDAITARISPLTRSVADRLTASGYDVVGVDTLAPIVFLRANVLELGHLNGDVEIESLDWAGTQYEERMNVANAEVKAASAWSYGGVSGSGAKVAIVEYGRVCPSGNLPVAASRIPWGPTSWHTTAVASCVKSNHWLHKGIAPSSTLISANLADFTSNTFNVALQMPGSVAAINWSISQGAHIMNLSYGAGSPTANVSAFDRYLDYVVRNNAKTVAIACGNSGAFAGDPGAGFNAIAVGSFNDAGASTWAGETMAGFSSWMNPSTGVETPQVAAPGVSLTMLDCAGGATVNSQGTSFSSPIVAGEAALIVSKAPSLGSWPEAIRAIIMATAWHNIEGLAELSSRDGAGGVDAYGAMRVTTAGKGYGYQYGYLSYGSFDASGLYTAQSRYVFAGQTIRACLSFDSTVTGSTYSSDSLKSDLDLYVYGPTGTLLDWGTSAIQPFEMVQFVAPTSGYYTLKVKRYSMSTTGGEYYGTALSTSSDI